MERNQKINCTVSSCRYNNEVQGKCILQAIQVTPTENNKSKNPYESMCSSYIYEGND